MDNKDYEENNIFANFTEKVQYKYDSVYNITVKFIILCKIY